MISRQAHVAYLFYIKITQTDETINNYKFTTREIIFIYDGVEANKNCVESLYHGEGWEAMAYDGGWRARVRVRVSACRWALCRRLCACNAVHDTIL